jgi:hypothetical protein
VGGQRLHQQTQAVPANERAQEIDAVGRRDLTRKRVGERGLTSPVDEQVRGGHRPDGPFDVMVGGGISGDRPQSVEFLWGVSDGFLVQRTATRLGVDGEQCDDRVCDVGLPGASVRVVQVAQRSGDDALDVSRQPRMGLCGVEGRDSGHSGALTLEGVQFRPEGECDQAFVQAECQRRHGAPGYSRCAPGNGVRESLVLGSRVSVMSQGTIGPGSSVDANCSC